MRQNVSGVQMKYWLIEHTANGECERFVIRKSILPEWDEIIAFCKINYNCQDSLTRNEIKKSLIDGYRIIFSNQ